MVAGTLEMSSSMTVRAQHFVFGEAHPSGEQVVGSALDWKVIQKAIDLRRGRHGAISSLGD
jgi:hypothetical protein